MAKKSITLSEVALGILAIVAGSLVIWKFYIAQWIIGIFLIVWGALTLIRK